MVKAALLPSISAAKIAKALVDNQVQAYGPSRWLLSDKSIPIYVQIHLACMQDSRCAEHIHHDRLSAI